MGSVLNRATLEFLGRVNVPDHLTEDWVINPDLSPVSAVPQKYWTLTGDVLSEMSQGEKDVVDVADLPAYKQVRYDEIDLKTGALILAGFTYDSHIFSASANAQTNWNVLKDEELEFTWPVEISCLNNDVYSLTQAKLDPFWTAGKDFIKGHLDSGRTLKKSIFDVVTRVAGDAVVDNR